MPDVNAWITALRTSHDRFVALVAPLSEAQVQTQSYASEWTVADVASHLGSQAEIFGLFLDAGLNGTPVPGGEVFVPIWDRWNATAPIEQVHQSIGANEAFVSRIEQLPAAERDGFALDLFGARQNLGGMLEMRMRELAMHSWDIAVALDPAAVIPEETADLLVDGIAGMAGGVGVVVEELEPTVIDTTGPSRQFLLTTAPEVSLVPNDGGEATLTLPAEALMRLIAGRLDAEHAPADVAADPRLPELRRAFPGF